MNNQTAEVLRMMTIFIPLLFVVGFFCVVVTRNLVRTLIGIEVLSKAVTLLLVVAGYTTGRTALAQACVITLIMIEAVVVAVAAGIIVNVVRHTDSLDRRNLEELRG
jgi:NADH:ubiquinone oxidoreductase subunit K